MSDLQNHIKIVTGMCPHTTGGLAFQDPAPIHQCVFQPSNLHTVSSREEAFNLVASIEQGCGSCSNVILHPIESDVEIIWSGCGNVKAPIIDKALDGLNIKNIDLIQENNHSAHVLIASNASLAEIQNRFIAVYSN